MKPKPQAAHSCHPNWTLTDEKIYLDDLGSWGHPGPLMSRANLLRSYIICAETLDMQYQPWRKEAADYARKLLELEGP